MKNLFFLLLFLYSFAYSPEKDLQDVYSQKDYDLFLHNKLEFRQKVVIGLLGFENVFSVKELKVMLEKHMSTIYPKIRNGKEYSNSRVVYGVDFHVIHLTTKLLVRYQTVLNETMTRQFLSNDDVVVVPKASSNYIINLDSPPLQDIINRMEDQLIQETHSAYSIDIQAPLSIIFVNPSKSDMLPTIDKNAEKYYFRYYFRYKDENMISFIYVSSKRFVFVDVAAGPIVSGTELDVHNIHNSIPFELAYDVSLKMNSISIITKNILQNILFPSIVNSTHFLSTHSLLIPIVFFTTTDEYSPRIGQLQQEMEEIKMSVRSLFKSHFRTRRVHLMTELIYLNKHLTLSNSIQSTFIDSIILLNQNNTITYKQYSRIDGEQLSFVLYTALQTRKHLFSQHRVPQDHDSTNLFPFFVLDVGDHPALFEGRKLYYSNANSSIVIRSESRIRRGFSTDPNYYSQNNYGNRTLNWIVSSMFEGIAGIENFNIASSYQKNLFMLALGHHPFQTTNEVKVGKIFTEMYQRNKLVLLVNSIIEEIESCYIELNDDLFSVMGNPLHGKNVVITREYLKYYYIESYPRQPAQYQKLFADLVNLCNQFSFYIDSFMDIDFKTIRQDSESDLQVLMQLLQDVRQFRQFSKTILSDFMSTAQCSELKHVMMYSTEISVETMLIVILLVGTVLFAVIKYFI